MPADIILKNAHVVTMDRERSSARLIAIKGGRITAVGDDAELGRTSGPGTRIIDCGGQTVIPGFIDAHCHIFSHLRKLLSLDLSPAAVSSISDIKAALRRQARVTPPGRWLSGTGFNEFYLAEKRCPRRGDIDQVAPDHPVVLSHRSLHACVLNSLALSRAGITIETPDPPGAMIERDPETGEPTGLLYEMLGYIREKVMPAPTRAELSRAAALANEHYLAHGITSLQEATVTNDLSRWKIYRELKDQDILKSRIRMMMRREAISQFEQAGLAPGTGDDHLGIGAIKVIINETTGQLYPPQAELNGLALRLQQTGYQLAMHAVEPNTVNAAITALEYALKRKPGPHRHRIEHCSVCPPDLLERLRRIKAVVVTQPPFIHYSGDRYLATVFKDHQPWLYRIRSLLDAGIKMGAGSDSPIVPDNPLVGIYATITRQTDSGQKVLPDEAITAEQALALYTTGAAYAAFEEDRKGSITPGKLADLVVLSDNPLLVPAEQARDIRVVMTIIDGRVAWEK